MHFAPAAILGPVFRMIFADVGDIQGETITGMQGIGVNTPKAAAVAAATAGFVGVIHMPNGKTLTIGAIFDMAPTGLPQAKTRHIGRTLSILGAMPKEH